MLLDCLVLVIYASTSVRVNPCKASKMQRYQFLLKRMCYDKFDQSHLCSADKVFFFLILMHPLSPTVPQQQNPFVQLAR